MLSTGAHRDGVARFRRVLLGFMLPLLSGVLFAADDPKLGLLERLVGDESPKVRVEALRALSKIRTARAAELALTVLDRPMDRNLDYALWLTINDLSEPWIEAVRTGAWKPEGREKQLEFALKALKSEQVGRVLGTVLGDRPLARDGSGPWIEVVGVAGSAEALQRLFRQAQEGGFDEAATVRVLKALADANRTRKLKPGGDLSAVSRFLESGAPAVRTEAARLAGQWKEVGGAVDVLLNSLAANPGVTAAERGAAFEALRNIGGEKVVEGLKRLSSPGADAGVRRVAVVSLAALDSSVGFPAAVAVAGGLSDETQALELWRGLLAIKGASLPLRDALGENKLPEIVARAGLRVAREGGRNDLDLVAALAKAGGLAADPQALTGELIRELAAKAAAEGDPDRGEMVYRRTELACITCHAIGGAGGKVGPDMTSIGASAPLDYLVEALLQPNAKIKEGYHSVVVETRDGEEVSGTVARETQEELVLRNAAGQDVVIPKPTIAKREMGKLSLMPSGLLEPLEEKERLDLFAFLSRLGKPGEFDASRGGVARVWHVANVVHTDLQNNEGDWFWKKPFTDRRWVPVMARVNGTLTRPLLEQATRAQAWTSKVAIILVSEIEHATGGRVRFKSSVPAAELWVAGKPLGTGAEISGEVPAGRHRVVLKLDPRTVPEVVRLEAEGAAWLLN